MDLILYELKKIFSQKINWFILILTIAFPLIVFYQETNKIEYGTYFFEDGTQMSDEEIQAEIEAFKTKWTGEMTDEWWTALKQANKEAVYYETIQFVDEEKMIETYGNEWFERYFNDRKSFGYPNEKGELEEGLNIIYTREHPLPFTKDLIYHFQVRNLYLNYASMMLVDRPWNSEDGTYGSMRDGLTNEIVPFHAYSRINMTFEELSFLKDYMNEKESFHYGDSKGWMNILNSLSSMGVFLMIWMILISSQMVNKERTGMIEMLSSMTYGRGRLFTSKVLASFIAGVMGLFFNTSILMLVAFFMNQIGDAGVNVSEGLHMVSIFTYQESFWISLFVITIGLFVISMIGIIISTWMKSSYLSLAVTCMLLICFNFLGKFRILFPMGFMSVDAVVYRNFTISIFNHAFLLWKLLPMIWFPVIILLFFISFRKFLSKNYSRL